MQALMVYLVNRLLMQHSIADLSACTEAKHGDADTGLKHKQSFFPLRKDASQVPHESFPIAAHCLVNTYCMHKILCCECETKSMSLP